MIDRLLLGPGYVRWLLLLTMLIGFSLILFNRFVVTIWDTRAQLDRQYSQMNSQLERYQRERERINLAYRTMTASLASQNRLENLFSKASSEVLEAYLIENARQHDLQPSQIQVSSGLMDHQGEYFRVLMTLTGAHRGLEYFLKKLSQPDYFLIWEQLQFKATNLDLISLTISIKQYVRINNE